LYVLPYRSFWLKWVGESSSRLSDLVYHRHQEQARRRVV
jgi:hypothetical protein